MGHQDAEEPSTAGISGEAECIVALALGAYVSGLDSVVTKQEPPFLLVVGEYTPCVPIAFRIHLSASHCSS